MRNKSILGLISEIDKGIPSSRLSTFWPYKRKELDIFSKLSVYLILKPFSSEIPKDSWQQLIKLIENNLPLYANPMGRATYNFWPTEPSQHFPNGFLMKRFKHFKLPDDIDDTALAYFFINKEKQRVEELRKLAIKHSQSVKGGFAYNTWFGEKMPYEIDVCANSNLLFLFKSTGLKWQQSDIETLKTLEAMVLDGAYLNEPFKYARHYGTAALIIYHLARLFSIVDGYDYLKVQLLHQAQALLNSNIDVMDSILIETAVLKLGGAIEPASRRIDDMAKSTFSPFIGAPFAPFHNSVFSKIASKPWAVIKWECEAIKWAYILENLLLRESRGSKQGA